MIFATGQTINEIVLSLDVSLSPISATTFDVEVFQDGLVNTGITVNMSLVDAQRGAFMSSWSASTNGTYQVYYKNNATNLIYITELYQITPFGPSPNIYVGL